MPTIHRFLAMVIMTACTASGPNATSITSAELVGTWTGTSSNGYTYHYTFGADGSFQYGQVSSRGEVGATGHGTFSIAYRHTLALDGTFEGTPGGSKKYQLT